MSNRFHLLTSYLLSTAVLSCGIPAPPQITDAEHVTDVETWRLDRYDVLHREGWLKLTGLHWLTEGSMTLGAATDNDIVLGGYNVPDRIGVLHLVGDTIKLVVAPAATVTENGKRISDITIKTDASADRDTTVLDVGSLRWHIIERNDQYALRVQDSLAPAHVNFDGLAAFPTTQRWRLSARFDRYTPPKTILVPNVLGTINEQPSPGAMVFEVDGTTYRLDVVGNPDATKFWIQFGDETNGLTTYGGGRYIWVDAPTDGDMTIIDFNKSYNPPCVFSPYATCPLPPRQNKLTFPIEAGEVNRSQESGIRSQE